jgi:hypothetical protein
MTRPAALVLAAVLLAGCGVTRFPSDMEMRLSSDAPDQFLFERPLDRENCLSPAIDPADGTRLTLERSRDGRGDYAVPPGRYGSRADELLRISCATGRPIGLVPR